jgi:zinc transport system ATP-binding protein
MMKSLPILSAQNISVRYGDHQVLKEVSIELNQSEIVTLIGPNGAGKTSLIRVLLGLLKPDSGVVKKDRNLNTAYVPQKSNVHDVLPLRVKDFLLLAKHYPDEKLRAALDEVQIGHLINKTIQGISGGELQRVLLARALLKEPNLLILDEPAKGVDIVGQQLLYSIIKNIRDNHQCGVLMVSHDLHLVMASTDKVVCLNSHVCCTGHPDDVSEHPEYIKLFGSALEGLAVYSHHHDHEHDIHGDVIGHQHECDHDH